MSNRIVRIIRKRITQALHFEIEFSRVQRGLERAMDDTLGMKSLHSPGRMIRRAHRRARVILRANLNVFEVRRGVAQAVDDSIDQIPPGTSRALAKTMRRQATKVLNNEVGLPEVQRGLEEALDSTLDLMSQHSPRKIVRNVHRRAKVVLKANLKFSRMRRRLAQAVDETIDQIPLETPKGIARIVRRRATKILKVDVGLAELQRGLGRTFDNTLELMPFDAELLVKHGAARSKYLNRQLAWSLAFVAGAVNAGGFLAVQSYTSHVTGAVSRMADELALGHTALAMAAFGVVVFFLLGSFCSGLLISLGKRRRFQAHYALSLMLEAGLLLLFGLMGYRLNQMHQLFVPFTVALLSFIMGMHNSVVTTISNAEVRTTHLTGIVTDLGLELSRLIYFNVSGHERTKRITANRDKLKLHGLILASFFGGGVVGALGFKHVGFKMTIFLAAFLFLLAWRPVFKDVKVRFRLVRS